MLAFLEPVHYGCDLSFDKAHELLDSGPEFIEVTSGNLGPDHEVILILDITEYLCQGLPEDFPVAFLCRPPDLVGPEFIGRGELAGERYFEIPGLFFDAFCALKEDLGSSFVLVCQGLPCFGYRLSRPIAPLIAAHIPRSTALWVGPEYEGISLRYGLSDPSSLLSACLTPSSPL